MNLVNKLRAEISYHTSLRLLSRPEENRERLAQYLKNYGYDVEPNDFIGARLMTGPEDRRYLKDRYGVTFYPSTLCIPDKVWFPSKYGGRGLLERLTKGKLSVMEGGYLGAW